MKTCLAQPKKRSVSVRARKRENGENLQINFCEKLRNFTTQPYMYEPVKLFGLKTIYSNCLQQSVILTCFTGTVIFI